MSDQYRMSDLFKKGDQEDIFKKYNLTRPKTKKPKQFRQEPMIAANKAINQFNKTGLFHATAIGAQSGSRSLNRLIRDSNINK